MPEDESTCHVLRLQKAKADLAELELEKLRGSVIPVELVEIFGTTLVTITKNRFLGVPSRLRNEFPDVSQALFNRLDDLIRESLEELGTSGLPDELSRRISEYEARNNRVSTENRVDKKSRSYRHRPPSW